MQNKIILQPTTLYFPSLSLLWTFSQTLKVTNLEINTREMSLTCVCSEEDTKKAISDFKATLHQNQSLATSLG
jgi:hypothetical protein